MTYMSRWIASWRFESRADHVGRLTTRDLEIRSHSNQNNVIMATEGSAVADRDLELV